jgi:hypothetical protein
LAAPLLGFEFYTYKCRKSFYWICYYEVSSRHEAWILIKYKLHAITIKITELVFFVLFNLKRKVNALGAIFVVCNAS